MISRLAAPPARAVLTPRQFGRCASIDGGAAPWWAPLAKSWVEPTVYGCVPFVSREARPAVLPVVAVACWWWTITP